MSTSLTQQLEREFGTCVEQVLGKLGPRPLLTPASEEELCEVLRFAGRERLSVLPLGFGSKLDWMPALERVDLALSTRALQGIVAYEPGDGTLTALAGSSMSDLEQALAAGGHHLTPQVPTSSPATLGGVLAAGQSGWDRGALGPARHHVLGMRVALADGRVVRSGGRLVKNVTGFDLHRLHAGSFGSLSIVLEASIRLFPASDHTALVQMSCTDLNEALALANSITAAGYSPRAVALSSSPSQPALLQVFMAGRAELTEWLCAQVLKRLPRAIRLEDEAASQNAQALRNADFAAGRWSDLRVTCMPSRVPAALDSLRRELPDATVHVRPVVAEILVSAAAGTAPERIEQSRVALSRLGVQSHARHHRAQDFALGTPSSALGLQRRIREQFDPGGVFAGRVPSLTVHS